MAPQPTEALLGREANKPAIILSRDQSKNAGTCANSRKNGSPQVGSDLRPGIPPLLTPPSVFKKAAGVLSHMVCKPFMLIEIRLW